MEPATVKQIVPLIGRAGRPTQIMFYISKERLKEIFHCAKEKYVLKANSFKHQLNLDIFMVKQLIAQKHTQILTTKINTIQQILIT